MPSKSRSGNSAGSKLTVSYGSISIYDSGLHAKITSPKMEFYSQSGWSDSTNNWRVRGGAVTDDSWGSRTVNGGTETFTCSAQEVTLLYGQTQTFSFIGECAGVSFYENDNNSSYYGPSLSITFPARAYSLPAAPTGIAVARVSDTQHTISWVNHSTGGSTTAAPYSNLYLERWDNVSNVWSQIASLSSSATSFSDTTTVANKRYQYRVRAYNSSGYSAYNTSAYIATTPAAPTMGSVSKTGTTVTVNWSLNNTYGTAVELWHAANGVWDGAPLATLAANAVTYNHTGVNTAQTHTYKVRAKADTLYSAYSADSATVTLLNPPNAPTVTATPAIGDFDDVNVTVNFVHNPTDATAQTNAAVRWKKTTDSTWTTSAPLLGATTYSINLDNGFTYEIQAQTKGDHATYSPWSSSVLVTGSAKPQALLTSVAAGAVLGSSVLPLTWSYYDPDGSTQSAWRIRIWKDADLLWDHTEQTAATTTTHPVILDDNSSYSVGVTVRDSSGLWSNEQVTNFTTSFPTPPTPTGSGEWLPDEGAIRLSLHSPSPGVGEEEAVLFRVRRLVGTEWVIIAATVDVDGSGVVDVIDPIPFLDRVNTYEVVSTSAIPTVSEPFILNVDPMDKVCWVFVNSGPGWSNLAKLRVDPAIEAAPETEKVLVQFDGRHAPVEYMNPAAPTSLVLRGNVSGDGSRLDRRGDWKPWIDLATMPAPVCYRDHLGRRLFCSVKVNGVSHSLSSLAGVGASFVEVDYDE